MSSRVIRWAFQAFDALRTSCWGIMNVRNMTWTLSSCHFVILTASLASDLWDVSGWHLTENAIALQLNSYDYFLKNRPEKSGQCVSYSLFVHSMDAFQWTHKHTNTQVFSMILMVCNSTLMNEWMNEWCLYIALYYVLLYTQSASQSCGGGLSSTTMYYGCIHNCYSDHYYSPQSLAG